MELNQWSHDESKKQVIKTEGYWIYYSDGSKCMDIQSGNTAFVLGYSDSEILESITDNKIGFLRGNSGESSKDNDELIQYICEKGNWESLAWAVSGSDAVETAIAMNDCYWEYIGPEDKEEKNYQKINQRLSHLLQDTMALLCSPSIFAVNILTSIVQKLYQHQIGHT